MGDVLTCRENFCTDARRSAKQRESIRLCMQEKVGNWPRKSTKSLVDG